MIYKSIIKISIIFLLFLNLIAKANDIESMSSISEAAGSSAQAAADQLASDASQVVQNISGKTLVIDNDLEKSVVKEVTDDLASNVDDVKVIELEF